jgi:selenocysteine lyase/cysteine desulfurase
VTLLPPVELDGLWEPERPYLNTASFGLPPRTAYAALQRALEDWRHGRTSWEPWTECVGVARAAFARIVGCRTEDVATGATVSELVGLVAASLPDDARVVVPDVEFTSNLFPWLVQQERGVTVEAVPLERLVDSIDRTTTLVAFSAVQSSSGEVADVEAIAAAAWANDALVFVDATQACGWAHVSAASVDFLVCHGYKWLLAPRGTAFLTVRPEWLEMVRPLHAGWWSAPDPYGDFYRPPLRLAADARRLDTSPAWFSWVGAAPALELLERIGIEGIGTHNVDLANRFRAGLELEPSNSAIVTVDVPGSAEKLARAGIAAAVRADRLRVSFHLYNTAADVDAALDALRG